MIAYAKGEIRFIKTLTDEPFGPRIVINGKDVVEFDSEESMHAAAAWMTRHHDLDIIGPSLFTAPEGGE